MQTMFRNLFSTLVILLVGLTAAPPPAAAEQMSASPSGVENFTSEPGMLGQARRIVDRSVDVIRTMRSDAKLASLLARSRGVFIAPDIGKGASGYRGGTGSDGVFLARRNRQWSNPAFFNLSSVGISAPKGGLEGAAALVLMSDEAVQRFATNTTLSLGGADELNIAEYSTASEIDPGKSDVIVWSERSPSFTAATLSAANITVSRHKNRTWYGQWARPEDILRGEVENPRGMKLQDALSG